MKLPKISLGTAAKKRYPRSMSFDNNTTMDFGFCEPLLSMRLEPNAKINCNFRQFVRLAPMPLPTFGRVSLFNEVSFCPISDVVPYYDALLARQSYFAGTGVGYTPTTLPYTNNGFLLYMLLCQFAEFTIYQKGSDGKYTMSTGPISDYDLYFYRICRNSTISQWPSGSTGYLKLNAANYATGDSSAGTLPEGDLGAVTFDGADYVFQAEGGLYYYCFRLSNSGRRLRKILIGLGYSLEVSDTDNVSIVPLLAYYKCWFDRYEVKRSLSWLHTDCFHLVKIIENDYRVPWDFTLFDSSVNVTSFFTVFKQFMFDELVNTWYVAPDDYISVQRANPDNQSSTPVYPTVNYFDNNAGSVDSVPDYISKPGITLTGNRQNLSLVSLQVLQRFTRFVNKDSVIGKKIDAYLRVHYGSNISNSVYKSSYSVARSRVQVQISDVFSTSDTADESARTGEYLGSYAGKGSGFNKTGFNFTAPCAGYIFMFSCIVPDSGTFQGNSFDLYALDCDTIPNPDYDALGYEVTPRGSLITNLDTFVSGQSGIGGKGFGFVPRYSMHKFKKNVVNGDMSRRGSRDSFSPYYLDRIIQNSSLTAKKDVNGAYTITTKTGDVPDASEIWRYICRYDWLGNFNRMFYEDVGYNVLSDDKKLVDDHFTVQSVFDITVRDFLKPISQSYDTYEESSDTATVDVKMD